MKRTAWMAAAFMCAATMAMAQTPSTTTSSSTTGDKDKITVSGCLQGGSDSSSATASTSTASAGMGNYVLVTSPAGSTDTATGTTGSTSTAATTAEKANDRMSGGTSYTLSGNDSELKNHVGHRIEVTGTVENRGDRGAATSTTATSTTTSGSASSRMSNGAQTLKVSSVKMISSSCTAK